MAEVVFLEILHKHSRFSHIFILVLVACCIRINRKVQLKDCQQKNLSCRLYSD